jgi:hypothetical protein
LDEVRALGARVAVLRGEAATTRPDEALAGAGSALPGSALGQACRDLAARWQLRLTRIERDLGLVGEALGTSAADYESVDVTTADAFAGVHG